MYQSVANLQNKIIIGGIKVRFFHDCFDIPPVYANFASMKYLATYLLAAIWFLACSQEASAIRPDSLMLERMFRYAASVDTSDAHGTSRSNYTRCWPYLQCMPLQTEAKGAILTRSTE